MNVSALMGQQVSELRHTLNLNLLKSQMATQTAQAVVMLDKMTPAAPHPYKGNSIDLKG
ncbi:hypothetical protein [Falsibacillus albus]|uniref:hypothetical protein n=1 Tax=Falsibacillus albus TaxID=2478915 RepID=UPI00131492D6|nr:hypothetical protein [Falsibacillus albus]